MLKYNKPHPDDENNFHSTKLYWAVCTFHACRLTENEEYSFRRHVGPELLEFDEDEPDLSGMQCPYFGDEENYDCTDTWEVIEKR
jgi:hypothetical protein